MTPEISTVIPDRRDWGTAFKALRRLLADANDTAQVFRIMRALNAGTAKAGYLRLMGTAQGGRLAYERVELAERFSDPAFIAQFREGTVGAAYAEFLRKTGYSATGLAEVSKIDGVDLNLRHPYLWYGRRMRDTHDIWHVLTGYRADEPLGELCLVAFSYAQTRGLGWGFIALGGALKALRARGGKLVLRAIREGYRRGKNAAWLPGEDYERLLAEPLDVARARLNITEPNAYRIAREAVGRAAVRADGTMPITFS
ncbi:ubiquinone biosynthesis protein COQ4 [Novosphingobium sp. PhB165]|uniref:ubiquinone biosynthesis protein COQ4 n=1 Tax=Novosphingobium sp. PhB165 TaxID=2485105 RepID=UPI0010CE99A0|nr:ubiquinone biosynthesis protein COQ4 [Novosphingobium sp. PhB165]TCM21783.1 ubiquinone biosynthesis protein COQ4 [Novosphingobium sp. PhB165]